MHTYKKWKIEKVNAKYQIYERHDLATIMQLLILLVPMVGIGYYIYVGNMPQTFISLLAMGLYWDLVCKEAYYIELRQGPYIKYDDALNALIELKKNKGLYTEHYYFD